MTGSIEAVLCFGYFKTVIMNSAGGCQVDEAFRHAMLEARKNEASVRDGLSFEQFMVMLRADSRDSLDQYDDRMGGSSHGGALYTRVMQWQAWVKWYESWTVRHNRKTLLGTDQV